jgi:hypothetical protein
MHHPLRGHHGSKSYQGYIPLLVGGILALLLATLSDRAGMPQKWHAAIVGTEAPFFVILVMYRSRWQYWRFWAALMICLAVHGIALYIFFRHVLSNVQVLGIMEWFPVSFIEGFVLYVAVQKVEQRLAARAETL